MIKYCIILILLLTNCDSTNSSCIVTIDKVLKNNGDKVFVLDDSNGDKLVLRDKGIDSIKGGEYIFQNGKLNSYKFFQTMNAYTYNEEYDNDGHLTKVEGKPLVNTKIREVNKDSAFFSFSFFSLNKIIQTLLVSINNNEKFRIKLNDDTLYSNMSVASFGLNTKELRKFKIYLSMQYNDDCKTKVKVFKDSVSLIKDSILNFCTF